MASQTIGFQSSDARFRPEANRARITKPPDTRPSQAALENVTSRAANPTPKAIRSGRRVHPD